MSSPEHGTKCRVPAPELESKAIPVGNKWQVARRGGPLVLCKTTRPLDEGDLLDGDDWLDEDEDGSRMPHLISSKRQRLENGTAQIICHKQERKKTNSRYRASYRLNRRGSGVLIPNKQRRKNPGEFDEEYLRQDREQQIHGGEEIEQDTEMSLALDSASGKEMLGQDALTLEPQARSQDVEREKCKEKQVTTLLEGAGAEPATEPEHTSKACHGQDPLHQVEIEQDTEMSLRWDFASGEEMMGQAPLALEPQARLQDVKQEKYDENQVVILLDSAEVEPTTEPEHNSEARHERREHHKSSCIPLSGDGCVPDDREGDPPAVREAMARPEQNDTHTQSLIREGIVERPTSHKVPDKDDAGVHCAHSEELGHHWQNDHVFSQADCTGPVPVASSTEPSPVEITSIICTPKLTPQLKLWVSSKVREARLVLEAKQDEEVYQQTEAVAREMMKESERQKGLAEGRFMEQYLRLLGTWTDTLESLKNKVWEYVLGPVLRDWDEKSALGAHQCEKKYREDEDRAASEAEEAAHSQIVQTKLIVIRPTSSPIETQQQEKCRSDEKWLAQEISSSVQKRAEKAETQKLQRRQTLEAKEGRASSAGAKAKGKAQYMSSSLDTSKPSTMRAPPPAQRSPSLSLISEAFYPSESHHTAAMVVDQLSVDEVDASTSVGPSQGIAQENTPSEMPAHLQALRGGSIEHPSLPNEHTSSMRQSEQEAAEQRRYRQEARELEEQVKAREYEKNQRRMMEVREALLLTQRPVLIETGSGAETQSSEPMSVQTGPSPQISESSKTPSGYVVGSCASGTTREQCGDMNLDVDTQQLSGQYSVPGSSSMGQNTLLSQLLEHSHASQSRLAKLANQLDELKQTVVSMASSAIQGSNVVVGQVTNPSNQPNLAPLPTVTRGTSSSHTRGKGPPGTFRDPVPPPVHREDPINRFHDNCRRLIQELLNQGAKNDNWPTPPTQDELNQYEASRKPTDGPTHDNFRVDFITRPFYKSVWNQQAAEVFAEAYLSSPSFESEDQSKLKGEFLTCLRRIHGQYQTFLQEQASSNAEMGSTTHESRCSSSSKKHARRMRRKATLYESRTTALQSHVSMQRFIPALEHLSRGGMSEDESDHGSEGASDTQSGPKKRRYKVLKVQWRSIEVTKWLRTMDLIFSGTKINEDGTATPGNEFRRRYPSDEMQIGKPITGLPRNFYNAKWLQTLSLNELAKLNVQPEMNINFTIDERKYAAKYIMQNSEKQGDRASGYAEVDPSEVSQWALTGAGFREAARGNATNQAG